MFGATDGRLRMKKSKPLQVQIGESNDQAIGDSDYSCDIFYTFFFPKQKLKNRLDK